MSIGNGRLVLLAIVMSWMLSANADDASGETAEDVVMMMAWWEEYGRYWDEIGTETSVVDEDMAFAGLAGSPASTERGLP